MYRKVIMIGGMPRSGTTMMAEFIQTKLNIPMSPETHFLNKAFQKGKVRKDGLPAAVLCDTRLGPIYKEIDGTASWKNKVEAFRFLLDKIFCGRYDVVGEKTPAHLMCFSELAESGEEFFFIIMKRSCVDVCQSLKNVPWNNGSLFHNAKRWGRYLIESEVLRLRYPNRVLVIDYELFCNDPEYYLENIKIKAGIDRIEQSVDGFMNFNVDLEPWKANSLEKPYKNTNKRNINFFSYVVLFFYGFVASFFAVVISKFLFERK